MHKSWEIITWFTLKYVKRVNKYNLWVYSKLNRWMMKYRSDVSDVLAKSRDKCKRSQNCFLISRRSSGVTNWYETWKYSILLK